MFLSQECSSSRWEFLCKNFLVILQARTKFYQRFCFQSGFLPGSRKRSFSWWVPLARTDFLAGFLPRCNDGIFPRKDSPGKTGFLGGIPASAAILGGIFLRSQYLFYKGVHGNCVSEAQWFCQSLQASVMFSLLCSPNFVHTHGLALAAKFVFHFPRAFHSLHFSIFLNLQQMKEKSVFDNSELTNSFQENLFTVHNRNVCTFTNQKPLHDYLQIFTLESCTINLHMFFLLPLWVICLD